MESTEKMYALQAYKDVFGQEYNGPDNLHNIYGKIYHELDSRREDEKVYGNFIPKAYEEHFQIPYNPNGRLKAFSNTFIIQGAEALYNDKSIYNDPDIIY